MSKKKTLKFKGDFVGSESETEKNESNRRSGGEYKSRKYISESSDDSSSTQLDRSNASASVACVREEVVGATIETVAGVRPAITANTQQPNEQSDNEKDPNEDADGVELVLDLDSNQVIKIFKNENQKKPADNLPTAATVPSTNTTTSQNEQNTKPKEEETNLNCDKKDKDEQDDDDDEEDEDGCLVIDLDKSTITHNNVIVTELDASPTTRRQQQLPKSSISITKREPTKKN